MTHRIATQLASLAVPCADLVLDPANARTHPEKNLEAIKASLTKFGQRKPIVVRKQDRTVIAGNGTLTAARALGWTHIAAVIMDDDATTAAAYAIADNRTAELAEWDADALGKTLAGLERDGFDVAAIGFDQADIDSIGAPEAAAIDSTYTQKVVSPIYEPTGVCPKVHELCQHGKATDLMREISEADIPNDLRDFLCAAATRHYVFDYGKIAEFYSHAPPKIRKLMEDSALVIVDFNRAIELGYVSLQDEMAQAYLDEHGDEAGNDQE